MPKQHPLAGEETVLRAPSPMVEDGSFRFGKVFYASVQNPNLRSSGETNNNPTGFVVERLPRRPPSHIAYND